MKKRSQFIWFAVALVASPPLAYVISYFGTLGVIPNLQNPHAYAILMIGIMIFLLAVPYVLIKLLAHAAKVLNPLERIPHLKDLPKDQQQLNNG